MTAGRLKGLLAKVEGFPGKQARATLVTRLKSFEQKLGDAESALAVARASEALVVEVFPDDFPGGKVPRVEESSARAARDAKRLRKKLGERIDFIADTKAEDLLVKIVESASGAKDAVAGEWKRRVSDRISALRPIAKVAKDAGLAGADGIVARLHTLEKFPVPSSSALAEQARSELASVTTDVTKIGLGGAAWEFLGKAIHGQARAKDLETPEVRAFLDTHRLWGRLTVKLG
ncbi:hypothetical protein [Sorangium sp. So ce388]|uniref:hypothetical protein n=1 Tax=Sorangium sp. So ce388 TaxID=3133309 RepID=UPI003F5B7458